MVNVAVVGAAGYTGIEAVRLVLGHAEMDLVAATSAQDAGRRIDDVYPALTGLTELTFSEPSAQRVAAQADLVFLAVPHTAALALVPALLDAGVTVVDLSADYRLTDPVVYELWYDTPHTSPELLARAVYGLPEFYRASLADAKLVACPGCYPTAAALAAVPALSAGLGADAAVIVDAKSGVSGAGRAASASTHYCAVNESIAPYKVATHRHSPEIAQILSDAAGRAVPVVFAPHLVPMDRGLLATVYLNVGPGVSAADLHELYAGRFAGEAFVRVHEPGRMPATAEVRGTNRAHVGLAVDVVSGVAVVACAIDNLMKGAAGQAVQCANIALGMSETEGLDTPMPVV